MITFYLLKCNILSEVFQTPLTHFILTEFPPLPLYPLITLQQYILPISRVSSFSKTKFILHVALGM